MLNMLWGFQLSQALYVAAKLQIADLLEDGPATVHQLAARCGAHPPHLNRLLRTLSALGVFETAAASEHAYANTPLSRTLSSTAPDSVRSMALMWMENDYLPFGHLLDVVVSGDGMTGAQFAYGKRLFEWYDEHPDRLHRFAEAMRAMTAMRAPAIAAFDPPAASRRGAVIADIGGGNGSLLATLLQSRPAARGVILDRAAAYTEAAALIQSHGLSGRVELISGDFFEAVPEADVYILSFILHDWSDSACCRILGCIKRAMKPSSVLAILELVVPGGDDWHLSHAFDITMLGMLDGMERSEAEYAALLADAGFALTHVEPTPCPFSWLYAAAADQP